MKRHEFGVFTLFVCVSLSLIALQPVLGDITIGVSFPDYDNMNVLPNQPISGTFTVFNQGDENITAYAEVRNAPGTTRIEWQSATGTWIETQEMFIPTKEHRYSRFTVNLGELIQGQFYNWSIVVGYIDPDPSSTHAVAANGIQISMIWPLIPPWYDGILNFLRDHWLFLVILVILCVIGLKLSKRVRAAISGYRSQPTYEERKRMAYNPDRTTTHEQDQKNQS